MCRSKRPQHGPGWYSQFVAKCVQKGEPYREKAVSIPSGGFFFVVKMFCISDWTTSQYGSCGIDFFGLLAIQPLPLSPSPGTDDLIPRDTLLTRDTLRDPLSSRLQWCHRRVQTPERTIPPHHSARHCTCRWRTTTPPSSRCIPTDKSEKSN